MEQIIKNRVLSLIEGLYEQRCLIKEEENVKEELVKTTNNKYKKISITYLALIVTIFSHSIPINLYAEESKAKRCKGDFIVPNLGEKPCTCSASF